MTMNRLTTDYPQNNFETMMNLVYGKDGWQYVRHGEAEMRTTDFCLMLCKERGCVTLEHPMSDEEKDELLCDCVFDGCPIATIYAALSGFGHIRARLKMYEDAGILCPASNAVTRENARSQCAERSRNGAEHGKGGL